MPATRLDVAALRAAHPSLVVLSITPYGLTGPWAGRRANEFTLQAESGSLGMRGLMGQEPFQAGGRIAEWAAGTYGAVAALPAVLRARAAGRGEHIDLSILETANFVFTNCSETMNRLMNGSPGDPEHAFLAPSGRDALRSSRPPTATSASAPTPPAVLGLPAPDRAPRPARGRAAGAVRRAR